MKNRVKDEMGEEAAGELKDIVGHIGKLRHHMQTNKPLEPFMDQRSDVKSWNQSLSDMIEANSNQPIKWFTTSWLFAECYMYRCIQEAVEVTKNLSQLDVFKEQKQTAFSDSSQPIRTLLTYLKVVIEELPTYTADKIDQTFHQFMQVALWGNKCDLSISAGAENHQTDCILTQLKHLQENILINDTNDVLHNLQQVLSNRGSPGRVDIVLDNAGFELVTDLCLADYLMSAGLASHINFHAKAMPWFVSDVTFVDFDWTLEQLASSDDRDVSSLGAKWKERVTSGCWVVHNDSFWTMPNGYCDMSTHAKNLYALLSESDLVIFKGDLNYRKLVEDRQWSPTVQFSESLQRFAPAPLCTLRTIKSDVVTGLTCDKAEEMMKLKRSWMTDGSWAVISYQGPPL